MTLSRKDFFRQGFFSLGDTLMKGAGVALTSSNLQAADAPPEAPDDGQPKVATANNEQCLARSCGCFSCIEQCENQAITLLPGKGISVATDRCTGCGICTEICPVTPKAILLIRLENVDQKNAIPLS